MPREGHDLTGATSIIISLDFNPRAPRGARPPHSAAAAAPSDFNPRAPRGARHSPQSRYSFRWDFNPRAPRGARQKTIVLRGGAKNISIHVPREGHDDSHGWHRGKSSIFQSTCPARGTTLQSRPRRSSLRNFNPRAPRGARRAVYISTSDTNPISIHVPREGHDHAKYDPECKRQEISIHVPREGHDLDVFADKATSGIFQSTCPARGTTYNDTLPKLPDSHFNPRAPRGARHTNSSTIKTSITNFNPRAPRGARHYQ